jgi:hypothetical protein
MKRLDNFIQSVKAFALFAGLYLEKYLEQHLIDDKTQKPVLVIVCAFLGLIAVIKVSEKVAEFAIERWRGLRRTILGDNYIEGVWFNKVPINSPLYGLLRIEIKDSSVRISGEQYDRNGAMTATWHSEMARFDGSILSYAYRATYSQHGQEQEVHGVSQISFAKVSRTGEPRSYNGHYHDSVGQQQTCCFTGFRLDANTIEMLDKPTEKLPAVKQLIGQADKLPQPVQA